MAHIASATPPPDAVVSHLAKLTASPLFQDATRLCDLLRFTVSTALDGRGEVLKESVVGVEVFGRKAGYDSQASSVVRVEFARLRKKLEKYYATEGRGESIRIGYLKGSYVPEFRWQQTRTGSSEPARAGSLAVLPLAHLGSNSEDEYFAAGLTEELITALGRVPGLKVVARTSAFAAKAHSDDVREIGRALNVDSVLEGSVRRQDEVLRIHAQLINVEDGSQIWAQRYERRLTDIFKLQDEIAAAIVEALEIELTRVFERRPAPRAPDMKAYELYLKGRYWWHRTVYTKSAAFFREAIECDPGYAAPYSGLADAYLNHSINGYARPLDLMPQAEAAARRAIALDETLAEAHCSLGMIENAWNWDSERCRTEILRCMELNPGYALALAKYGTSYLSPLGRFDEAYEYIIRALDLDPLSPNLHADLAVNLAYRGQFDRFDLEAQKVLEMDPGIMKVYSTAIGAAGIRGNWAAAVELSERAHAVAKDNSHILGFLVWAYYGSGQRARADEIRNRMAALARERYVPRTALVTAELGGGSMENAFTLLEQAVQERDPMLRFLWHFFPYRTLQSDARFKMLMQKVGL